MNIAESTRACLVGAIDTMTPTEYSIAPQKFFTKERKAGFKKLNRIHYYSYDIFK